MLRSDAINNLGINLFAVLSTYLFIFVFFYSLGKQYANMYLGDGNVTGSPQSLEKRRDRAKLILYGARQMSQHVMSHVFRCEQTAILCDLLANLKCLHKICLHLACTVSKSQVGHKITYKSTYTPHYLQSVQMDCFILAAEMSFLFGHLKPFIDTFEHEYEVVNVLHIALVTSRYLQAFVLKNSAFHAQPPPPFKVRNQRRSQWQY